MPSRPQPGHFNAISNAAIAIISPWRPPIYNGRSRPAKMLGGPVQSGLGPKLAK